eukprot:GEMP01019004.1.p1 GENE.GEMP01019004.1~~GEMP01019004.1.p1  ORF type:complete len:657 (+),score=98.83 GEMP01019004.1:101-1972(+)
MTSLLTTASAAVLNQTESDRQKICGERSSTTLRNRGAAGLRADLGPYFHVTNISYSKDRPAVVRQEDGSGFVFYPSSRRALVLTSWNKCRRYSVCVFADQGNSALLGSFNEWGQGMVCAATSSSEGSASQESSLAVKSGVVTLNVNGKKTSQPIKSKEAKQLAPMELNLNEVLTVKFEFDVGMLSFELNAKGVRERFFVGEVLTKMGDGGLTRTTSDGIIDRVKLGSTTDLNAICSNLTSLKSSLRSIQCPPYTTCSLQRLDSTADLQGTVKTLTDGRFEYNFDHKLKKHLRNQNPPHSRFTQQKLEGRPMGIKHWSGKITLDTNLKDKKGIPSGLCRWVPPKNVSRCTHSQLDHEVASGSHAMIVAVLFSPWDAQSIHGIRLAEGLQGRVQGTSMDIFVTLVDMGESGALISKKKFVNRLAETYKVSSTPWLLVFSKSTLIVSEKLSGFRDRLRYFSLARARALLVEPSGTCLGERAFPNGPKNALTSQSAIKRAKLCSDTAFSGREAMVMLGKSSSAYGFLFVSTEVPFAEIESLHSFSSKRNPECLFFLIHHPVSHQCDPEVGRFANDARRCTFVFVRPLSTSSINQEIYKFDSSAYDFPDVGMNAEQFCTYITQLYEGK